MSDKSKKKQTSKWRCYYKVTKLIDLNIESEQAINEMLIFSTNGALINSFEVNNTLKGIDISIYQKGAYFIVFKLSDMVIYKKFIKL